MRVASLCPARRGATVGLALIAFLFTTPPARSTPVKFHFRPAAPARTVAVAGSFNGWSAAEFRLADPDSNGVWDGLLDLLPGRYAYKFVVDSLRWYTDLTAAEFEPDGFNGRNSVLRVGDLPRVAGSPADSPDDVPADGGAPVLLPPYPNGERGATPPRRGPGSGRNGRVTLADFATHEAMAVPFCAAVASVALARNGGYVTSGLMGSLSLRMLVFRAPGTGRPQPGEAVLACGLLALSVADLVLEAAHTRRTRIFWINFASLGATDLLSQAVTPGVWQRQR